MTIVVGHRIKNVLGTDGHPEIITEAPSRFDIN